MTATQNWGSIHIHSARPIFVSLVNKNSLKTGVSLPKHSPKWEVIGEGVYCSLYGYNLFVYVLDSLLKVECSTKVLTYI